MASGDGTTEIVAGIVMSVLGFGSILSGAPVICCGFAIFGPILFIVGLVKLIRGPPRPAYLPGYYPPPYYQAPGAPPPAGQLGYPPAAPFPPPTQPAPPAVVTNEARKRCGTCGSMSRVDAKFCTSCGAPF